MRFYKLKSLISYSVGLVKNGPRSVGAFYNPNHNTHYPKNQTFPLSFEENSKNDDVDFQSNDVDMEDSNQNQESSCNTDSVDGRGCGCGNNYDYDFVDQKQQNQFTDNRE